MLSPQKLNRSNSKEVALNCQSHSGQEIDVVLIANVFVCQILLQYRVIQELAAYLADERHAVHRNFSQVPAASITSDTSNVRGLELCDAAICDVGNDLVWAPTPVVKDNAYGSLFSNRPPCPPEPLGHNPSD